MFAGNPKRGLAPFATDHDTFRRVKDLIAMRKAHVSLRRGTTRVLAATEDGPGLLAFAREHEDQTAVVVLNNAPDTVTDSFAVPFDGGTALTDVAPGSDGGTFTVAADGTLEVTVGPLGGRVLVAP